MPAIHTEDDVCRWMLACAIVYLASAYLICFVRAAMFRGGLPSSAFATARLFDGVTFASSILLLAGIADPTVLLLLGNVRPFLMIAGLAGALHALHGLFPAP